MKVKQEDGTEIEVFTPEEVEAQKKTAAEEAVKAAVAEKEAELTKIKADLEGLTNKDHNFSQLRKQKEELESRLAEYTKTTEQKIKEVENKVINKELDTMIRDKAAGDPEMEKKIRHHYNRLSDPADSADAITQKLNDAILLASGGASAMGRAFSSAGGVVKAPVNHKPMSPELKNMASKFGITDEDIKKVEGTK